MRGSAHALSAAAVVVLATTGACVRREEPPGAGARAEASAAVVRASATAPAGAEGGDAPTALVPSKNVVGTVRDNLTYDDPQQLIISADTRESVAAAYLDAWKRRIEAVGAAYLPELGELKNLTGSPTMLVRISETGELLEVHVSRTSGSPILDLASVDIIQRASPFDEFPAAMAEEYDKVAFEYKFLFAERLVPRD